MVRISSLFIDDSPPPLCTLLKGLIKVIFVNSFSDIIVLHLKLNFLNFINGGVLSNNNRIILSFSSFFKYGTITFRQSKGVEATMGPGCRARDWDGTGCPPGVDVPVAPGV